MKSLLSGVGCAALLFSSALSIEAAHGGDSNWGGFYAGGQIGYGFGIPSTQFLDVEGEPGTEIEKIYDITPNAGPGGAADCAAGSTAACTYARDGEFSGGVDTDASGINGGLHVGYNFQPSAIVIGLEGDYDWSGMDGSGSGLISPKDGTLRPGQTLDETPQNLRVSSSFDYLASLRGRLGYATDQFLIYGTVGVAWTGYSGSATSPEGEADPRDGDPSNESGTYSWSDDRVGWVAGGGIEMRVTENVSIRFEALHYDFGTMTIGHNDDLEEFGEEAGNIEGIFGKQDISVNQVRIGASYRLN